jgi:hypothetical protein
LRIGKKSEHRVIGAFDPNGVVKGNDPLKLTEIRRPVFFGQSPYFEDIAKVEQYTYTVEFTVPRGLYEQRILKVTEPIKLRGWFIKGKGVPNAKGKRTHALLIDISVGYPATDQKRSLKRTKICGATATITVVGEGCRYGRDY